MENVFPHLHAVIVCGQSGNGLWPLARDKNPRETIVLPGDEESLLESTLEHARAVTGNPVIFVCHSQIAEQVRRSIESCRLMENIDYRLLVEPCQRGDTFAIALAAAMLKVEDPEACIMVMSPHARLDGDEQWEPAVSRGCRAAEAGKLAVVTVPSRRSNSPHSFARLSSNDIQGLPGVRKVTLFTAKATQQQANRYVSLGLEWSTGTMFMKASTALASLQYVSRYASEPASEDMGRVAETAEFLVSLDEGSWQSQHARELVESLPDSSFAEAVLEVHPDVVAVSTTLDYVALESLADIDDALDADEDGNRVFGRGFAVDSYGTTVFDVDRLTVTLGCEDIMVVNTRDAVLVASKDALDSLDSVVPSLVEAGGEEALSSSQASYGWGTSTVVFSGESCRISIMKVYPGKSMGKYTRSRIRESWTVVDGAIVCVSGGEYRNREAGSQIDFEPGEMHELKNMSRSETTLLLIERDASGSEAHMARLSRYEREAVALEDWESTDGSCADGDGSSYMHEEEQPDRCRDDSGADDASEDSAGAYPDWLDGAAY